MVTLNEVSGPERSSGGPLVNRIEVDGLHGSLNYDLPLLGGSDIPRLSLFYGDNGAGKTTILRLLWDALSPSPASNHRTRIADVAFSLFRIHLRGSVTVSLTRKLPVTGPYSIEVRRRGRILSKSDWPEKGRFDEYFSNWSIEDFDHYEGETDPEVIESAARVLAKKRYLAFLTSLGGPPFFLADDRSTASDEFTMDGIEREPRARRYVGGVGEDSSKREARRLAVELETSIKRTNQMLQTAALGGAASGFANANSVYLEVLNHIGNPLAGPPEGRETLRKSILDNIRHVSQRSAGFEQYGLTPRFAAADFARAMRTIDDSRLEVAVSVLRPYLESLSARLDALDNVQELISTFVWQANSFLTGKEVTYTARSGIRIHTASGDRLTPLQLSSGECHIILLLCNALLAREGSRLFLIDEPELSLNVKWQRRVIAALLECTKGSGVQFLIATHSIELLSSYRENVVRMQDAVR